MQTKTLEFAATFLWREFVLQIEEIEYHWESFGDQELEGQNVNLDRWVDKYCLPTIAGSSAYSLNTSHLHRCSLFNAYCLLDALRRKKLLCKSCFSSNITTTTSKLDVVQYLSCKRMKMKQTNLIELIGLSWWFGKCRVRAEVRSHSKTWRFSEECP